MNLLLIDSRLDDVQSIVSSLNETCKYVVFSYEHDSFDSLKEKISALDSETGVSSQYACVGIAQLNYGAPVFDFLQNRGNEIVNLVKNVEIEDGSLNTWIAFSEFCGWITTTTGCAFIDLLACNIWSDPDWVYVIKTLRERGIYIRASVDITGVGGNFILESDGVDTIGVYFTDAILAYKYSFDFHPYYQTWNSGNESLISGVNGGGTYNYTGYAAFTGTYAGNAYTGSEITTNITGLRNHHVIGTDTYQSVVYHKLDGTIVTGGAYLTGGNASRDATLAPKLTNIKKVVPYGGGFFALKNDGTGILVWGANTAAPNASFLEITAYNLTDAIGNSTAILGITNLGTPIFINTTGRIDLSGSTGSNIKTYVSGSTCFGIIKSDDSAYLYDNTGTSTAITGLTITKIYANATGATSIILCSDNTIRNVSKTILFTLNPSVYVRKFIPFYSNNWGICFTDNRGAFSITNVITNVVGMTDFVANAYCYAYILNGSVVTGGTTTYITGIYAVQVGESVTDGNVVKLWSANNTSFIALKNDRTIVGWGVDISPNATLSIKNIRGELTSCINIQNTAYLGYNFSQNNVIYALGYLTNAGTTIPSIQKTQNKNVDIQCISISSLVDYDASFTISPSTITYGVSTTVSYWSNDPNMTAEPYRVYALCYGKNIVGRFTTPDTPTNTYSFSNVLLSGEFADRLSIYDITATNSLALSFKICELRVDIIQPPSEPIITKITYSSQSATVYFTIASNGGNDIIKYQYSVNDGIYVDAVETTSPIIISGLTDGQITRIQLVAVNAYGQSISRQAVVNGSFNFYNSAASSPDIPTNTFTPNWTYSATGTTSNFVEVNGGTYNGISVPANYTKQCVLVNNQTGAGNGTITLSQPVVNEKFGIKKIQFNMAHVPFPDETAGYLQVQYDSNIIGNIQLANTQIGISNAPTVPFTPYTIYFDNKKTPTITLNPESVVKSIDGLQLWLDAQDTASLTLNGASLTSWVDTSPNATTATKFGTYATNAQYSSTGLNGLPAIQFTNTMLGTNNGLSVPIPALSFSAGMSIFVVFSRNGAAGSTAETLINRGVNAIGGPFCMNGTSRLIGNGTTQTTYTSKLNISNRNIAGIYSCVMSKTTINEYFNGYNTLSSTTTGYVDSVPSTLHIATRADNATGLNGSIGQIIIYSRELTTIQRQTVELYLKNRWNMSNLMVDQSPYTKIPATNLNMAVGELKFVYYSARLGTTPSATSTLHLTGISIEDDGNEWIVPRNATQAPQMTTVDASNSCAIVNLSPISGIYPQKYQYSTDGITYTDVLQTDTQFNGITLINGASISDDYYTKPNGKYSLKLVASTSTTTTQYAILPAMNKTTAGFSANFWMRSTSTMATPQTITPLINPKFDTNLIENNAWRIYSSPFPQTSITGWSIDASTNSANIILVNGATSYTDAVAPPTGTTQVVGLKTGGACYGMTMEQTIALDAGCYTFSFYMKARTGGYNTSHGLSVSLIGTDNTVVAVSPIYTNIATSAYVQIQLPMPVPTSGNYTLKFTTTNPALVDSTIYISGCAFTYIPQTNITPVLTMNAGATYSPTTPAMQLFLYGGLLYSCINNGTQIINKMLYYASVNDSIWYHVSFNIADDGTQTTYINGILQTKYTAQPLLPATNYITNYLGMSLITSGVYDYNGYMDDVRIYGRALTSTEAMDLYNYVNQTAFALNTDAQLLGRWKFNYAPYNDKIIVPLKNGYNYNLQTRINTTVDAYIQNYNFMATQYSVNTKTITTGVAPTGWTIAPGSVYFETGIVNRSGTWFLWNPFIGTDQGYYIYHSVASTGSFYQYVWLDIGTYTVSYYYGGSAYPTASNSINVTLDNSGVTNSYNSATYNWYFVKFNVDMTSPGFKKLNIKTTTTATAIFVCQFTNFKITSNSSPSISTSPVLVSPIGESFAPIIGASPTDSGATITFTQDATPGTTVLSYKYSLNGGQLLDAAGITSPITISGITNGTTYSIQLFVVNSLGYISKGSNVVQITPYKSLSPINIASVDFSQNNVIVKYPSLPHPDNTINSLFVYSLDNGLTTTQINTDTYTMVGTPTTILYNTVDKKIGNASMFFQGGYLTMPAFNSSSMGISVAGWFNMASSGALATTYSKLFDFGNNKAGTNTGYNNICLFTKYNGAYNPAVSMYSNIGKVYALNWTNATFDLDKWYHIAVVFNTNQTVSLYVNGVSLGDKLLPYPEPIFRTVNYIGASTSTGEAYNFYGKMDDFRVYNGKMLSLSEINTLVAFDGTNSDTFALNNIPELAFYYTFNQQPQSTSFIIPRLTKNTTTNITPYVMLDKPSTVSVLNANFDALYIEPYTTLRIYGATDILGWTIDTTYTVTQYYLGRGFYNLTETYIKTVPPITTNEYYLAFPCNATAQNACKFYTNTYLPIGYITVSFYANIPGGTIYLTVDDSAPYTHSSTAYTWALRTISFYNYTATTHKIAIYSPLVVALPAGTPTCFTGFQISCIPMQFRIPQKIMHYSFNTDDISGTFIKNQATGEYDASLNGGAALSTIKKYDTASVSLSALNRFVKLPSFTLSQPTQGSGLTISFWYYGVANPSSTCNIISLKSTASPTNEIVIQYATNTRLALYVYNDAGANTFVNPALAFSPSTWMHMMFTIKYNTTMTDATYSVYINGALLSVSTNTMNYPKAIMRDNNVLQNPGSINFNVDDFKIFTDCLNSDEIREIYNQQYPTYEKQEYKSYVSTRQISTIGAPDTPTLINLVPSAPNQFMAHFDAPANNGGETITGYKYSIGLNSTELYDASGNSSPIILQSVPSNKLIDVFIYAVNSLGVSLKSNMISNMAFGFDNTPLNYVSPTATSVDVSFQELVSAGYQPMQYKYTFNGTTTDFSNQIVDDLSYKGKCLLMNNAWTYDGFVFGTNANSTMTTSGAGTNATTIVLTTTGYVKVGWVLFVNGSTTTSAITAVSMNGTTAALTLATGMTWATGQRAVAYPNGDNQMYITIGNGNIGAGWKYKITSGVYTVSSTTAITGVATITFAETITGLIPSIDMLTGVFTPPPILFNSYLSLYPRNQITSNPHVMFENMKYEQTGLTVAFWMWSNLLVSTVTAARLFTMNNNFGLTINASTGIISTDLGNLSATNISTTISANTFAWVHVAFTITASKTITIYLNGTQNVVGSILSYPAYNTESAPICVIGNGLSTGTTDAFQGYISDFRFYNGKALTSSEISTLYAYRGESNFALDTDTTLATRFKFDLSENEYIQPRRDYSLLNGVKYDSENVLYGVSSFRFDSSGSTFVSPQIHTSTLIGHRVNNKRGFSVSLWAKPNIRSNSGYTNSVLLSSNVSGNMLFELVLYNYNTMRVHIGNGGNVGTYALFNVNINNNAWNHIVFVWTHTAYFHLYVNGSCVGVVPTSGAIEQGDTVWPIMIGGTVFTSAGNNTTNAYNGNMDDIRMYTGYILTQQEIQTLYAYRGQDPTHYLNTHPSLHVWCKAEQTMTQQQQQLIDTAYIPAGGAFISTVDKVVGTASMRIPPVGIVKLPALTISATVGISIAFWVRCQSYASNNYILDFRSLPSTLNEFSIVANAGGNGSIGMYINGGLYSTFASGVITTNQWVHVAFITPVSGSTTLYVNGVSVPAVSTGYPTIKGKTVNYLSSAFGATFNGYIDDLRIYNGKVLTAGEVASIYAYRGESGFALNTDATLTYYPFEPYEDRNIQCAHTVVKPALSTPLKINNVQYTTDSVVNKYAIYIPYGNNGKAGYISFPGIALHPHGFTISSWIKQPVQSNNLNKILFQLNNSFTGMNGIMSSTAPAQTLSPSYYAIYVAESGINTVNSALINATASANTFTTGFNINNNEWYFMTIVFNAMQQSISLYLNGVLVQTQMNMTYMSHVPCYTSSISIGNNAQTDGYTGLIDDFRFYNGKILTEQEIMQLYAYRGELGFALDADPALTIQYPKESYSSAKSARDQVSGLITGTSYPYTLSATLPIKNLIQNGNFDADGLQSGAWTPSSTYRAPTYWTMSSNLISTSLTTPKLAGTVAAGLPTGVGILYPYTQTIYMDLPVAILTTIDANTGLYQNVYLTPDTYTFSFYAVVYLNSNINVSLYSSIGSITSSSTYNLSNKGWNKYTDTFTISTAGVYPVKIGFTLLSSATASGIFITGVSLSKTTTATRTLDVIPYTNPDAPVITSIIPGNSQLTVNITQDSTGGLPIEKYSYSLDSGTTFQDFSGLNPLLIRGLTNGINYPVLIKANNGRLESTFSNQMSGKPFTNPDAPVITSITPGNAKLVLYITQGATGGLPIEKYSYSLDSGTTYQDFSSLDPLVITGLTNGTTYSVLIKGNNGMLDSSNSNQISETPFTNPDAPVITSITSGNSQLTINITQGATGGFPIEKYRYSLDNGSTFQDFSGLSPLFISDLTNGTTYPVFIKGYNGKLESSFSNQMSGKPYTNPDAPTITNIIPNNQSLTVYYTNGISTGGNSLVKHKYSIDSGATFQDVGLTSPFTISNLVNTQTYTVLLRSNNILDSSDSLPYEQEVFIRPTAPTINSAVNGSANPDGTGNLIVDFTPSLTEGTYPITKYKYSINGGSTFTDLSLSTQSPFTISGLTYGTTYQIVMRSTSKQDSNNSNIIAGTPYAYPDPPTITSIVSALGGILYVYYTLGSDYGSPLTMISFTITNGSTYYAVPMTTSPLRISGLTVGQSYHIMIKAHNANGISSPSNMMTGTPAGLPGAPTIFSIVNGMNSATVAITPGTANGTPILGYQASLDNGIIYTDVSYNSQNSAIAFTGLTNGITTEIYIRAVNAIGVSQKVSAFVKPVDTRPPNPPTITSVSLTEEGLATIAYQLADDSPINSYTINASSVYGNMHFQVSQVNPVQIYNLYKGIRYTFSVSITNSYGTATSLDSSSVIIATKPYSIFIRDIIPNYDVNDTLVYITYPQDGGSPITKYQYSINSGEYKDISGLTAPFHIHDLSENIDLRLKIKAINLYGEVESYSSKTFTIATSPPQQIGIVQTTMLYKQMKIKFMPVANNGAIITSYSYLLYKNDIPAESYVEIPPTLPIIIDGLELNAAYSVQLIATNRLGNSIPSNRTQSKLYVAYAPSTPVIYQLLQSPGQITVYTIPSISTGVEITNYLYSIDGAPFIQTADSANTFTVSGLNNNHRYTIAIKAMNEVGISSASRTYSFTIFYGVPRQPYLYSSYIKLIDGFTFTFKDAYDSGSPITGYKYRLNGGEWINAIIENASITVVGLDVGAYVCELLATNANGDGDISYPRLYRTLNG